MNYQQEFNKIISLILEKKLYGPYQLQKLLRNYNFNNEIIHLLAKFEHPDMGYDILAIIHSEYTTEEVSEDGISIVKIEESYKKYKKYFGFPKTIDCLIEDGIDVSQICSENPYVVVKHHDDESYLEFDFENLSSNPDVSQSFIEKYIKQRWNFRLLSENQNLSMEFINKNRTIGWDYYRGWDWYILSMVRKTIKADYLKYPDLPWNTETLYQNPNIDIAFIKRFPPENTKAISANPGITMEDIIGHPEIEWDYLSVSKNPNLTIDFLKKNLDQSWDWYDVSENPGITIKDIINHPDLPWIQEAILRNPNLTADYVEPFISKLSYNEIDIILLNQFGMHPIIHKKLKAEEEKERVTKRTAIFEEELIEKTWDPSVERNIPRIMTEIIDD